MKFGKLWAFIMALSMVSTLFVTPQAHASAKRRIIIMPFEYGAVESSVGTCDVGKGITSLLTTRLVQDGTYAIIERQMLDSILKEQNLSVSDRADPATACKIGKILSADAVLVGTVTQFGVERHSSSMSMPSFGGIPYVGSLPNFGTMRSRKAKAKVTVDARLIDINSTETIGAATATAESKTKGDWSMNDGWDFNSSDFASSVAGDATTACCDQLVEQLKGMSTKIADNQSLAAMNVQGKIADVTGAQVIVNVGKINGIANGDNLQVERVTKTVKDPVSGKVLKEITSTIAIINITSVDPDSSTGTLSKGGGVRVGDNVRKVTTDVSAVIISPLPSLDHTAPTGTPVSAGGVVHTGTGSVKKTN